MVHGHVGVGGCSLPPITASWFGFPDMANQASHPSGVKDLVLSCRKINSRSGPHASNRYGSAYTQRYQPNQNLYIFAIEQVRVER